MFKNTSLLLLSLFVVPAAGFAQEVDLSPEYKKGSKSVYDVEVSTDQTLSLAGMNIDTDVSTFEVRHVEVLDATPEGVATLKNYSSKLQIEMSLPGGITLSFDSDNPDQENAVPQLNDLLKLFKIVSKMESKFDVDPEGEISELKMTAEGLDQLPEELKTYITKERMAQELSQETKRLPRKKIAPKETWTRAETFDAGSGQMFYYTTEYTYVGQVEENGKKYEKVTATYAKPKFVIEAGSALPIGVKSSDLSMDGSQFTLLLDPMTHDTVRSEGKSIFKGEIILTGPNGEEIPGELDLKISAKATRRPK